MLQRLRNKLTMEQAGVQVNLVTLSISDKNMLKDFNKHRIEKTNNKTLFWIVCVMVHLNLIPNLLDFLVFGKSLNKFIITQLPQLLLVYVWAITLCTKPSLTRFVFFGYFTIVCVICILASVTKDEDSIFYVKATIFEIWLMITTLFFAM